jgi:hypothetical protein
LQFLKAYGIWGILIVAIAFGLTEIIKIPVKKQAEKWAEKNGVHGTFSSTIEYAAQVNQISITFPYTFPSTNYQIIFSFNNPSSYALVSIYASSKTTTGCTAYVKLVSTVSGTWQGDYIAVLTV